MQTTFKTIGLVVRKDVQSHLETIQQVTSILEDQADILIHYLDLDLPVSNLPGVPINDLVDSADLVISLGGDGTLLTAARALVDRNIPLLGINLGRLGFLADVSIKEVEQHLKDVLEGKYRVEKRFFIEGEFFHQDKLVSSSIALNDIIVHSHESLSMIEYEVYSNGNLIHQQRADGVIVTTPTGSTAYALSGGGPIMHPSLETLAIVPICPHTLSNRPIVVPADHKIEISLTKDDNLAQLNYDGQAGSVMNSANKVQITRCARPLTLLHPENYDYFQILRAKLYWSTNY
ncbi:MAG: NAD(+) kinase [Gammaproteobacteria bacterium]|nr:NAD(+) kinase [Gammaproteobacteria bacterium]